jgi:hypothetical protein
MNNYYAAAILAFLTAALGIWTKFSFVQKKHLYGSNGRPHFAFKDDCLRNHKELQTDLKEIREDVKKISQCIIRIEARLNAREYTERQEVKRN